MAIALNMVHVGLSPFAVTQINGDVTTSIVAAGTTQGTATVLGSAINDVATCPSNAGVQLPANATTPADFITVYNGGANTLKVYGLTGDAINNGSANGSFSVATTKSADFVRVSATAWRAVLSA